MTWPKFLVEELADRRCAIVVGAGVSRSCATADGIHPPTWKDLLSSITQLVPDANVKSEVDSLIALDKYLPAAQVLVDTTLPEDRERVIKGLLDKDFAPSEWITLLRDLDQSVYITTNYDCILEDACPKRGFRTHIHNDREAVKVLRNPERLILKVHGCIRRDSGSLVLSMSDYHAMHADRQHCLRLLEAIFTTNTGLFLGYSMNDPDLQLVMQNVRTSFPFAQPHILFTEDNMHTAVREAMEASLNLRFITYPSGKHDEGMEMLRSLVDDVTSLRASRTSGV